MSQRLNGVVNRTYLTRINTVFLNYRVTRQVTYAYDMIRCLHASFLDREHRRVYITATAVEVRCMHVDNERFTADLFGKYTGRIGQPVVTVDDIEVQGMRQYRSYRLVVTDLFNQVVGITTRETDAA